VIVELPVLVTVSGKESVIPTVTLPKARLVGLDVSSSLVSAVPTPFSITSDVVLDALLVIESEALKVPAALGVNVIVIGVVCPAATLAGRLGAVRAKYLVETEAELTVTESGPELVAFTVMVLLLPAATFPKFRLPLARERVVVCV